MITAFSEEKLAQIMLFVAMLSGFKGRFLKQFLRSKILKDSSSKFAILGRQNV